MLQKTTKAVADAKEARREKKDEKLTKKIEDTKAELKEDGHIPLTPAMITLPEFEEERMALMAEEHDILVDLVDHMHALSSRVDQLEQTYKALAIEEKANRQLKEPMSPSTNEKAPATTSRRDDSWPSVSSVHRLCGWFCSRVLTDTWLQTK